MAGGSDPEGHPTAPAIAPEPARERASPSRIRWAVLLARICDVDPRRQFIEKDAGYVKNLDV